MKNAWPEFMTPDDHSMKYWSEMRRKYPSCQICICREENEILGLGNSIPISWSGDYNDLPHTWTDILIQGVEAAQTANTLVAVNIAIHPDHQKRPESGVVERIEKLS